MAAESGQDRISALSDKAVRRVLSFLQAREAVRTCLLSRRWRGVWKSMPVLRITEVERWVSPEDFNKFFNRLLFFRDLTPLEEFEFTTYPSEKFKFKSTNSYDMDLEPVRYFEMWIRYALMRKVRVLRARVSSLRPHIVKVPPIISQHLVTLELECVVLDSCSMDFSSCPLLEDLTMKDCRICTHKMSSQSLRTPFLGSTPLLVSAFIKLPYDWMSSCEGCGGGACIDSYGCENTSEACSLLQSLSNATNLELKPGFEVLYVSIFKRDLKWCPTFSKLKTLVLAG